MEDLIENNDVLKEVVGAPVTSTYNAYFLKDLNEYTLANIQAGEIYKTHKPEDSENYFVVLMVIADHLDAKAADAEAKDIVSELPEDCPDYYAVIVISNNGENIALIPFNDHMEFVIDWYEKFSLAEFEEVGDGE